MSAAEDDTELRDLLLLNLENSGVLNKIKAEMRAAVFLAMEDQDQPQGRSPLMNQQLHNCLQSPEGGLAVGLILDFLQVFNLDFSLSVFHPEINTSVMDNRDTVCRDLCLSDTKQNVPLLLELVRRGRQRGTGVLQEDLSENQIVRARTTFKLYDKGQSGLVLNEDLKNVFMDLFPSVNRNMLQIFINDELKTAKRSSSKGVDFQLFLQMYKHLFSQCRAVVTDGDEEWRRDGAANQVGAAEPSPVRPPTLTESLDLNHDEEGDSFFDDPLPKPQKTYGGKVEVSSRAHTGSEPGGGSSLSEQSHTRSGDSKRNSEVQHPEEDVEYDDDFNSHRSELSRSELSIGEEIEEVSIEGPAHSEQDSTQDLSVSQLSHGADYMEEVS